MNLDTLSESILNGDLELADLDPKVIDLVELARHMRQKCLREWSSNPKIAGKVADAVSSINQLSENTEISAISNWTHGISEITKGNLDRALDQLRRSKNEYQIIGNDLSAAESVVAMMIPFGMKGDYQHALEEANWALGVFVENENSLSAGKVELNLSNIASRLGKNLDAKKHAKRAIRLFRQSEEKEWITLAENDLAHTLTELADFEEAEKHFQSALRNACDAEMHVTEAEILASIGNLATYQGDYARAIRSLETSRTKFEALEMPHQSVIAELEIAEIYKHLNLRNEAKAIFEEVCARLKTYKLRSEEARARYSFGSLLAQEGDIASSLEQFGKAADLYKVEGNNEGHARVLVALSELNLVLKKYSLAKSASESALELLDSDNSPRLVLESEVALALSDSKDLSSLNALLGRSQEMNNVPTQILLHQEIARKHLLDGDTKSALSQLETAIDVIETHRNPLSSDQLRMGYFSDKTAVYDLATSALLRAEMVEKAFEMVEKSRAKTLLDTQSTLNARENKELKSLRLRLNRAYEELEADHSNDALRARVEILEQEIDALSLRLDSVGITGSELVQKGALLNRVVDELGHPGCFIEYFRTGDYFSAFLINERGIRVYEDICEVGQISELVEKLRFQLDTLRYSNNETARFSDQINSRTNRILEHLYDEIILPFEEELKGSLVFSTLGVLNFVPLCALFDSEKYLVEEHTVSTTPSAAVWLKTREGDGSLFESKPLILAFDDENAPLVSSEAIVVSEKFNTAQVFIGDEATIANFESNLTESDIVHIACHGEFRTDNPMYSNLRLADGRITANDIAQFSIPARLVTLSACETGINKVTAGDEILGLARGFLKSGTKSLLLSLWRVNDISTHDLMKKFYNVFSEGHSPEESLRKTQLSFIGEGQNPFYWAAFYVI